MTYKPKDFFNYFKECYKLDNKEFSIENILSRKFSFKWFVTKKEELLYENLPIIPYINHKIDDLEKEIELYKLEKKLFYACFFILGENENSFTKDKRVCAPLLFFPSTIKTIDDEKYLEIERNSFVINRSILSKLALKNESSTKDEFVTELSNNLNDSDYNFLSLRRILDKYFKNINTEDLVLFPNVWSLSKIRNYLSDKQTEDNDWKIVPAACTILVNKSESSLKIINDLNEMAKKEVFNFSLNNLFNGDGNYLGYTSSFYQSRLNPDQFNALQNAHQFINSVIIGPPGTGKTYTIASIIADAVIKNQSVLVVSKTKQAVEVLRSMLQNDFNLKTYLIHTTGNRYKESLKSKIRRYLSGIVSQESIHLNENKIQKLLNQIDQIEGRFEKVVERELKVSDLEFSPKLNLIEKWKKFYLKITSFNDTKIWSYFDKIEKLQFEIDKEISVYSKKIIQQNIKDNTKKYRPDIAKFYDALDSNSFTEHKSILKNVNHKNILKVFPIWLANLSDLNSVLPLQADLFDLVIIDEATQCDIASALPAIYRAKRAVIAGDPNQLRHYSFVSKSQQEDLRKKFNLNKDKLFDYRNRSVLDLFIAKVQDQEQLTFLREHYRSTPSLIEFSNEQFYDKQLEILKSTPKHTTHNQIELIEINGIRDKKGINEIEAKAIIDKLNELINQYVNEKNPPSIGIISPFSAQVTYINKLLKKEYELNTIKKFNLLCGSPYHFQGSEREIILMSFCIDKDSHHSAIIHANKAEVLNVAITRAKSYQYVFKSIPNSSLKKDSLLYKYFSFIKDFSYVDNVEEEFDNFQNEVIIALKKNNYDRVEASYPLAGNLLDILITHKEKNYFIDLIGYPGMFKKAFPFERYKTLARIRIQSFPLHYSFWKKNKEEVLNRIKNLIEGSN